MIFNNNYEKIFFAYSLENPRYLTVTRDGFYNSREIDLMAYLARKFYDKFKETPSKEQMKLLIERSKKTKGIVTNDIVDVVYKEKPENYDKTWLQNTSESWIKWRNFDISLQDGVEYIKTTNIEPESVDNVILKFRDLINNRNKLSFDKDLGLDFFNPSDHVQHSEDKLKSGRTFVDNVTGGGYDSTGLIVYAGEQNIGKCPAFNEYITLKNKKTSKVEKMKIGDFFNLIKSDHEKK